MLYKRSSFLTLLRKKYECDIFPLENGRTLKIVNGPAVAYIWLDKRDQIDYEEIYALYKKLYLPDLPGESDLERLE